MQVYFHSIIDFFNFSFSLSCMSLENKEIIEEMLMEEDILKILNNKQLYDLIIKDIFIEDYHFNKYFEELDKQEQKNLIEIHEVILQTKNNHIEESFGYAICNKDIELFLLDTEIAKNSIFLYNLISVKILNDYKENIKRTKQ